MLKTYAKIIILAFLATRSLWSEDLNAKQATQPVIECDAEMLERARQRIKTKTEPFYTHWQLAQPDIAAALTMKPVPYQGSDSLAFHTAVRDQGIATRLLAYAWQLNGSSAAGAHAVDVLDRWATATPSPGTQFDAKIRFPNIGMDVARGMVPFVAAFDLLYDHPAMTSEKRRRIKDWFRTMAGVVQQGMLRWEASDDFGKQEYQNHHAAHVLGLAIFGAALRDERLIALALDSPDNPKNFKALVSGLILMPGDEPLGGLRNKPLHAGEIQDRHRTNQGAGLTYCHLSMTLMLYTADVLSRVTGKNWRDWKAPEGECLRLSATFYSDFFRLRNARINGDYYFRDQRAVQNNQPYLGIFEVALANWPEVPNLKAVVRSMNRARTPRSWLCYYGLPLLTHGVVKP